jgi:hypothetical protein
MDGMEKGCGDFGNYRSYGKYGVQLFSDVGDLGVDYRSVRGHAAFGVRDSSPRHLLRCGRFKKKSKGLIIIFSEVLKSGSGVGLIVNRAGWC